MNPLVLIGLVPPRVWMAIGGVLALGAVWLHGYTKGYSGARYACEEKAKAAVTAADKQDSAAQEKIVIQEKVVDEELRKQNAAQADRIKELEANAAVKSPSCVYPMPDPVRQPARGVRGVARPSR